MLCHLLDHIIGAENLRRRLKSAEPRKELRADDHFRPKRKVVLAIRDKNHISPETIEYGETDLRKVIEGDSRNHRREDSEEFKRHGFTQQHFDEETEELVDEDDTDDELIDADVYEGMDESYMDDDAFLDMDGDDE